MLRSTRISSTALLPILLLSAQLALHGQSLMVGPSSVEFRAQVGATTAQSQSVLLLGNQTTSNTVSVTVSNASWLSTPEAIVTIPRRITVVANPAGLPAGTYTASVTLQNAGSQPLQIPVTLTVAAGSQLGVNKSTLQFVYHTVSGKGTSLSDSTGAFLHSSSDQIVVTSTGNPLAYTTSVTTSDGANWLIAAPTTSSTPDTLMVRVNPAGLAAGTYTGTITLQAPAGGVPVAVSVQLIVSANPYIAPSSTALNLAAYSSAIAPVTLPLVLNASGTVPYAVFVTGGGWLSVNPANGNAPATLTVSANPAGLPPGIYNGQLLLSSSSSANPTLTIPVTLTVSPNAILSLSTDVLNFNFKLGDKDPSAPQTLTISSIPPGANYTIKSTSPNAGASFAIGPVTGQTAGGAPTGVLPAGAVTVQANAESNLVPGTYFGNVEVAGAGNTVTARLVMTITSSSFLTLSPSDVTFNIQRPSTFQAVKQVAVKSNAAPIPFAIGEIVYNPAAAPWLRATTAETITPGTVNLALDPTAAATLVDGAYTATLALDATTRINVTLNLSANRLLDLTPPELIFTAPIGGNPPAFQNLTATATDNSAMGISVTGSTTSGGTWLLLAPAASTPAAIGVGVNPTGLAVGRYEGFVGVSATGANPPPAQRSKITLIVPPAGALAASPASLRFTKSITGTDPAPQTVAIAGTVGAISYSVGAATSDGRPWLQVTPVGGTTPGAITVTVNSTGLAPGNYTGSIAVSSADASNSPLLIGVTFSVAQATFVVSPTVVNFGAPAGSFASITQQLQVSANPGGAVQFTAVSSQPWLTVNPGASATPASLNVTLNPAPLSAGVYSATITITATQAQAATVVVPVNVVIGPTATVAVTPSSVSASVARGASPQTATLTVATSAASTPINAVATTNNGGNWLTVNPPSGFASPTLTLSLILDPTGLAPGPYTGSVMVYAANAINSPITVPVTLNVSAGRQVLSQLADGQSWQTTITLVNMENAQSDFTLRFYAQDGSLLRLPIEGNPGRLEAYQGVIPPGGSRTIRTAGTDAALSQGWAELETTHQIGGVGIFRQRIAGSPDLEAAVSVTNPANRFLLAFDNLQSFVTSMALVNTNTVQSRGLNITGRLENGGPLFSDTINLPPRGQTAVESFTRFPSTANQRGVLDMTSSGDFTGLGLRFNPTHAFTSFPVLTIPTAPAPSQLLSQLADGGTVDSWQTTIVLVNLDTQPAPFTLKFWSPNGVPLAVPITGQAAPVTTISNTIAAGGTQTITTQGGSTNPFGGGSTPLITGWTELLSNNSVGGIAVFRQRVTGRPDFEAGVTATASGRNFLLPYDNTENFVTSMAIVNTNATTGATVSVTLRDESGTVLGTDSIGLNPRGQFSFRLIDRFPLLANRRGVVEFITNGPDISGLGLRFNPSGAYTSLPALPK
ncbi:MAG TPA: hypothetical protein VGK29_09180 [Paludibaculum sp.]